MSYKYYEMKISNLKDEINELDSGIKELEFLLGDANRENRKLRECRNILKDFLTTKECSKTWIEEMSSTIESVLKETEKGNGN